MAFEVIAGRSEDETRSDGIAVDAAGNTYLVGYFNGTADFDGGPGTVELVSMGVGQDFFVARYDVNGELTWLATSETSTESGYGDAIAINDAGEVFVTGEFSGSADFDESGATASLELSEKGVFLLKYGTDGSLLWAVSNDGSAAPGVVFPTALAADAAGGVYLSGRFGFSGAVDFDPGLGTALLTPGDELGDYDFFLARYDAAGELLWVTGPGASTESEAANAIALDATGNVFIAGHFEETVDFDPGPGTSILTATTDELWPFLAKYGSDGDFLWVTSFDPAAAGYGGFEAAAVDATGNAYVTGTFRGTIDFDPGAGSAELVAVDNQPFVAKYDTAGNFVWVRSFDLASSATGTGTALAVDENGDIVIAGQFYGTMDFDAAAGVDQRVATDTDYFLAKYDAAGSLLWVTTPDSSENDERDPSIAIDATGRILMTGRLVDSADFDAGPGLAVVDAGNREDFYLAEFTPDGALVGAGAPAAPFIAGFADDTDEAGDGVTRDRTLTLTGTAEAGSEVEVRRDGTAVDTVTADADGEWSYDGGADTLTFGFHAFTAVATDRFGNESEASAALEVFVLNPSAAPGNGDDLVGGGAGSSNIDGKNGNDTLFGFGGNDTLKGGNGSDRLDGGGDRDALHGGNGNDTALGGAGDDTLYGEAGNDWLLGGDGTDRLEGGAGADILDGAAGADTLRGGDGGDRLTPGDGKDRVFGDADGDWIDLGGDGDGDTVYGTAFHLSHDTIAGFETGWSGDLLAVTGLASKYAKLLDSIAVTDGVLSLSKVGGGEIRFEDLGGDFLTHTMLGADGAILVYLV
ncbi:hemolysin type calcium-binding protein [Stella humosa]|uniref:Hemolysin type calcium-binding protein n=1 Tax=Stella humosa TaxID=94 RepID=A0A3N1KUF3_9PROT|nr:Ig-like domain-containing protein [Stella humosa]ROP83624.1 hemolysin type calcium-binding protein [Stella humosa]BBK33102.1 hypothetical protein STHU_37360 [Stella humosa]